MSPININRHFAGKKSQARGDEFEIIIRNRCKRNGVKFTHHPLGCSPFGKGRFHLIKTGYDFSLFYQQRVCLIDAKAYDSDRLTRSQTTPHQVEALLELENEGYVAGYLLYLRKLGNVFFIRASQMYNMEHRSSIMHTDMTLIGSIESFDIRKVFEIPVSIKELEKLA